MSKTITDQTLALAGLFQAASLVQQIARQGRADSAAVEALLRSILEQNPATTETVYGGVAAVRTGLQALLANLGTDARLRDVEQTRYVVALLHLERKLAKDQAMLNTIGNGIENARRQAEHFPVTHENVVARLADIYLNTVSTLTPRIMVSGEHGYLNQSDNANRVRAILLAGMRSAVLWTQTGGNRWRLLFNRKKFVAEAQRLLERS